MKEFFSSIKAFIKKNVFSCLCLLLSFLVCITGSLSYAKYISSAPATGNTGVGSFSADVKINGVSSLSFTNTAFWGGTSETDKIAMNAMREIDFSVKNYQEDELGNKKVTSVKMGYDLVFASPQNFAEKLAMQLFDEESNPLTPQIVVEDFINSCKNGTKYNTQDSEDYVSAPFKNVSFNTSMEEGSYFLGVCYDDETGITTTIRIEFDQVTTHQQLYLRAWNNEASTSEPPYYAEVEGGKILPPVVVQYTNTLNTYRVYITMSDFVMPAGEECEKKYHSFLDFYDNNWIVDEK